MAKDGKKAAAVIGVGLAIGGVYLATRAKAAPSCTLGTTKCVGYDLYECSAEGKWVLLEENSTACGWTPPPPPERANLHGGVTCAETGQAIADALVTLDGLSTHTNVNGAYTFANIELGDYTIIVEKEGFEMASRDIRLYEGDNPLNIALTPVAPVWARLFGTVTDAETGAALAGVSVTLWNTAETELIASAFTNSSGYYLIENILPGSYSLHFDKDGYEPETR